MKEELFKTPTRNKREMVPELTYSETRSRTKEMQSCEYSKFATVSRQKPNFPDQKQLEQQFNIRENRLNSLFQVRKHRLQSLTRVNRDIFIRINSQQSHYAVKEKINAETIDLQSRNLLGPIVNMHYAHTFRNTDKSRQKISECTQYSRMKCSSVQNGKSNTFRTIQSKYQRVNRGKNEENNIPLATIKYEDKQSSKMIYRDKLEVKNQFLRKDSRNELLWQYNKNPLADSIPREMRKQKRIQLPDVYVFE